MQVLRTSLQQSQLLLGEAGLPLSGDEDCP